MSLFFSPLYRKGTYFRKNSRHVVFICLQYDVQHKFEKVSRIPEKTENMELGKSP